MAYLYIPSSTRGSGPNYDVWNITTDATISELTSGSESDLSAFQTRFGFELISPVFDVIGDEWKEILGLALRSILRYDQMEGEPQHRPSRLSDTSRVHRVSP